MPWTALGGKYCLLRRPYLPSFSCTLKRYYPHESLQVCSVHRKVRSAHGPLRRATNFRSLPFRCVECVLCTRMYLYYLMFVYCVHTPVCQRKSRPRTLAGTLFVLRTSAREYFAVCTELRCTARAAPPAPAPHRLRCTSLFALVSHLNLLSTRPRYGPWPIVHGQSVY